MEKNEEIIDKELLSEISDYDGIRKGAYNIRKNGQGIERKVTENINIVTKTDKTGIDIYVKENTKFDYVHIPVILTQSGLKDVVYNDFYIGKNANVAIIAGCGIHNDHHKDSQHDGIHRFFLEEGAKVKIFDPVGVEKIKIKYENNNFFCCNTIEQTIENTDICFIFTDWNVIKKINIQLFVKRMNKAIVLDGRNCFDLKDIPNGMIYESIGRKIIDKSKKI